MHVIQLFLDANPDGWEIYLYHNGQALGPTFHGTEVWARIPWGTNDYMDTAALPDVRKSFASAAKAACILLRPGALGRIRDELAILSARDEDLDAE